MNIDNAGRQFALEFLDQLTFNAVNYAILRNFDDIAIGKFKDIDLICPPKTREQILDALRSRNDVRAIRVTEGFSRSHLEVCLKYSENLTILFDLDYQISLVGAGKYKFISRLLSKSVTFSDIDIRTASVGRYKVSVLSNNSELLLLKNHIKKKPKEIYQKRISELENQGIEPKVLTLFFRIRIFNLFRRYFLLLQVILRRLNVNA